MNTKILLSLAALILVSGAGVYLMQRPVDTENVIEDSTPTQVENNSTSTTSTKPSGKLPAGTTPAGDFSLVTGTTWMWQKTLMSDGTTITPKEAGAFTITFSGAGKVSGKTDCNGFSGGYQVGTDGVLTFSPLASTLMFCEYSQEAVFTGMISKVNRYMIGTDGNLVLLLAVDSGSMIFKKQ